MVELKSAIGRISSRRNQHSYDTAFFFAALDLEPNKDGDDYVLAIGWFNEDRENASKVRDVINLRDKSAVVVPLGLKWDRDRKHYVFPKKDYVYISVLNALLSRVLVGQCPT